VAIPAFENISTALQAQWADVGVDVSISPIVSQETQAEWRSGGYDLYMASASGYPDPAALIEDWVARTNMPFGTDEELLAMHDAAKVLPLGSEERDTAYSEVNSYLAENAVIFVVCTWPVQILSTDRVGGVEDVATTKLQTAWDTRNLYVVAE
jgi:peptide/nickel transport system substrate-binding protein